MGNPDIGAWSNSDYVKLSGLLYRNTSVQISSSTLKRIFGKVKTTERYYPQKATRDALAKYAGFGDWDHFVSDPGNIIPAGDGETVIVADTTFINLPVLKKPSRKNRIKKYGVLAILLVIAAFLLFLQIAKPKNSPVLDLHGIELICKNPEGGNPHSAEFMIRLPTEFSGDTSGFIVNFDDGRSEKSAPVNKTFTYYYELPGTYYAILKYKGISLDTATILLKTNGWNATAVMKHDTTRVYPVTEFSADSARDLTVNPIGLFHSGVDTNRTFFVHFVNTKKSGISGDNFELTALIKTSKLRPGVRCSQVNIEVFGERSKHIAEIIKPGCVAWARLRFSDIYLTGDRSDLRSLGADLSNGGVIKLRVQNKKASLFLNDKLVYKTDYTLSLGTVTGIDINFAGIGVIRSFELKDLNSGQQFNR
ncbi:hypothetical protein [Niabella hirudinis]|uniref:hypothetical protein n=1 Tax=Niabella hirudinis TaxID=1285929 RepID=UPI003EBA9320